MTVSAHDARHVYHGATRNGFASAVREITDGIGHPDIRYVSAIIAKPPCKAKRAGWEKRGCQVWEVVQHVS